MADYTDNALLASIKALEHAVLPAVNPSDPLATEQLRLVTGMLKFLRARLQSWPQRHLFELAHYLDLAQQLIDEAAQVPGDIGARLASAIERGIAVQGRAAPELTEIRAATGDLSAVLSGLARVVGSAGPELRRRVERKILAGSKRWVDAQRAWFAPLGFELRAEDLPELDEALRAPAVAPHVVR